MEPADQGSVVPGGFEAGQGLATLWGSVLSDVTAGSAGSRGTCFPKATGLFFCSKWSLAALHNRFFRTHQRRP